MEAVGHGPPERVVSVKDSPGRLKRRVQEAVSGRPVPEGVQPRTQPHGDLLAPVDDVSLGFELFLSISVKQVRVKLFLCGWRKVLDFCK